MRNTIKRGGIKLGRIQAQFFAYTQFRRKTLVRSGEIAPVLGISLKQERELLSRMSRSGWITRIRRGLYAVPEKLPPGGKWSPGEYRILSILMEDSKGSYQITGPNAFNFYGFDNQVPVRLYVYNNRISGERRIGSLSYTFIKVADSRLGGTFSFRAGDGTKAIYSSKARALIDAVYDWSRFNGIPRAYHWIETAVKNDPSLADELTRITRKYGDQATIRRIGFILSRLKLDAPLIQRLRRAITSSKSPVTLMPTRPRRGTIDPTWGIIANK